MQITEVKPEQPSKATEPILVTESGIVIEDNLEQPASIDRLMLVKVFGKVIEVKPEQVEKAP